MAKSDKNAVDTKDETKTKVDDSSAETKVDTKDETANAAKAPDPIVDQTEKAPEVEKVIVTVPKAFKLMVEKGIIRDFKVGVQTVEKEIADHWYAKANGMKIFNPEA